MSSLAFKASDSDCRAVDIVMNDVGFIVECSDGAKLHVPFDWFPRLLLSSPEEREDWILIDDGRGIHWEQIDEDISVVGLVQGRRSGESETSLARWKEARGRVKA